MEGRLTDIDRSELLRYLRWNGGALPAEADAALERGVRRLREAARPRVCWRVFDYRPGEALGGTDYVPAGADLPAFLADCDRVILLAATLGAELDLLQQRLRLGDMGEAMILDAAGSAAVENVCDNLCADLAAEFAPRVLTDRFSPGYGDLHDAPHGRDADRQRAHAAAEDGDGLCRRVRPAAEETRGLRELFSRRGLQLPKGGQALWKMRSSCSTGPWAPCCRPRACRWARSRSCGT